MKRSLDQNAIFNIWCRETAEHCQKTGARVSPAIVKELVLMGLGNRTVAELPGLPQRVVAMRSHNYKQLTADLPIEELQRGHIGMDELLTKFVAWAATDLDLELTSPNEET